MFKEYNPNPNAIRTGDCAVRALAKALGIDWESAYVRLCMNGYAMGTMPDTKEVLSATLRKNGFYRKAIPNECGDCYTAEDSYSRSYGARGRGSSARRDSRGRYADRGDMVDTIRDMMRDAPDDATRMEFQRFIDKIDRR